MDEIIKNDKLEKLRKSTSLEIRLKINNEFAMIDLLEEIGFRKGYWTDKEDHILQKLCDNAQRLAIEQIKEFKQWKKDGCPK